MSQEYGMICQFCKRVIYPRLEDEILIYACPDCNCWEGKIPLNRYARLKPELRPP